MARFRRKAKVRRSFSFSAKRARRSGKSGNGAMWGGMLGAFVYGGVREYASDKLRGITGNFLGGIPGDIGDEVVMLGVSYLAAKGNIPLIGKMKLVQDMGKAGVLIESARLGQALIGDRLMGATSSNGTTQTTALMPNIG